MCPTAWTVATDGTRDAFLPLPLRPHAFAGVRFRFSCRCSRPKSVEPNCSSPSGVRTPRRLSFSFGGGASSATSSSLPRSLPGFAFLGCSAALRFCSCFFKCSESGLPPAFDARMASSGSLISGFWRRLARFLSHRRLFRGGNGASRTAGPGLAGGLGPVRLTEGFSNGAFRGITGGIGDNGGIWVQGGMAEGPCASGSIAAAPPSVSA